MKSQALHHKFFGRIKHEVSRESYVCILSELGIQQDPEGFKKYVRYSSR